MDDRVARLESAVAVLTHHVRDLELRLSALEGERAGSVERVESRGAASTSHGFDGIPVQQWLALVGRTLVVLGGAYLLRALTESHVLTAPVGVALGLLYGAPWLLLASRAGSRGAQLDALCHALATALIGYPLVWEATLRFGVLAPPQSAALLGALTAAALVLSSMTRLHGLAWVVTLGAFGSAAGLAVATGDWSSYTLLAVALGLGTLWLAYFRGWGDLRWVAAAGANLMLVFAIDHGALAGAPAGALLLLLLAFTGYVGSCAIRTLVWTHRISAFETAQSAAVIAMSIAGSVYLLAASGRTLPIGIGALALGIATYVLAFGFVRQRRGATTFFFWAFAALVLAGAGTLICAGATVGSLVYAGGAAIFTALAHRRSSLTLHLHASVCAIAACVGSGLVGVTSAVLTLPPAAGWGSINAVALLALVCLAVVVLTPAPPIAAALNRTEDLDVSAVEGLLRAARVPRLILVCALVWTSLGVAVLLATSPLGDPRRLDVSMLATLRTAGLVAATLVLARVARYEGGREAGWLMYPLLVATGLKLVFVDLPNGRPQTLFAALALYGLTLIVAPRLFRGASPVQPDLVAHLPGGSAVSGR